MASPYRPSFILNWRSDEIKRQIASESMPDWQEVFSSSAPVDLEVGIGNGSFLAPFAVAHPERNIIGIELLAEYAVKADKKLFRSSVTNGRLLIGDAKLFLPTLFRDESLEDVYVHFPDPWFKNRHKKRRMINPDTLAMMAKKMRRNLRIATDDAEYRDWIDECMAAAVFLEPQTSWQSRPPEDHFPTKYERKWLESGKNVYYRLYHKIGQPEISADEYINRQNLKFAYERIRQVFA